MPSARGKAKDTSERSRTNKRGKKAQNATAKGARNVAGGTEIPQDSRARDKDISEEESKLWDSMTTEWDEISPARRLELDRRARDAFLGTMKFDIIETKTDAIVPRFGMYNDRPLDRGAMSRLKANITNRHAHGFQTDSHLIFAVATRDLIRDPAPVGSELLGSDLPEFDLQDSVEPRSVLALAGQHRYRTANELYAKWRKELRERRGMATEDDDGVSIAASEGAKSSSDDVDLDTMDDLERRMEEVRWWGVRLYDLKKIQSDEELADHLSRNESKVQHSETEEESLVQKLNRIRSILADLGMAEFMKKHQSLTLSKLKLNINSSMSWIIMNVYMLLMVLSMTRHGSHFRAQPEFRVSWLKNLSDAHGTIFMSQLLSWIFIRQSERMALVDCVYTGRSEQRADATDEASRADNPSNAENVGDIEVVRGDAWPSFQTMRSALGTSKSVAPYPYTAEELAILARNFSLGERRFQHIIQWYLLDTNGTAGVHFDRCKR
ncbi:uncharacterized protein B0H18DRAFT_952330 [Fomitopsis serialis]|uniref:uncharacterized protein n=1 Tax=Fomitopsis serialis TaxID=139415 RepID=UPI0020088266|nr:uncharacterized protein B0H18DRAFT_952330 [Neoantrodia serialis]KAH9932647.1 hypothetical protein B0H18DRAFT_952330 [Neoantrodia serialis]